MTNSTNLWWFDTPMGLFDIALSFWLLFKPIDYFCNFAL